MTDNHCGLQQLITHLQQPPPPLHDVACNTTGRTLIEIKLLSNCLFYICYDQTQSHQADRTVTLINTLKACSAELHRQTFSAATATSATAHRDTPTRVFVYNAETDNALYQVCILNPMHHSQLTH
jgi:hypothetical protein